MLRILFECFESLLNGSNFHSNVSNPFRMIQISIRIPFEWFEFAFECFESILNGYNFSFKCLECRSKGLNLHTNPSNLVRML